MKVIGCKGPRRYQWRETDWSRERGKVITTPRKTSGVPSRRLRGRRYRASRFVTDIDITVKRSFPRIVDRFSTRERSLFTADAFSVWTRRRARWNGQVCIEKDNVDTGTPEEITLTALMCFRSQRTVTADVEFLGFAWLCQCRRSFFLLILTTAIFDLTFVALLSALDKGDSDLLPCTWDLEISCDFDSADHFNLDHFHFEFHVNGIVVSEEKEIVTLEICCW